MAEIDKRQVFISYSWEKEKTKDMALKLATELNKHKYINVVLDRWHLNPGDDKYLFMKESVSESDYVFLLLDEAYQKKADNREGGVGYEMNLITPDIYKESNQSKFIPLIVEKNDNGEAFAPNHLQSRFYIDLSKDLEFEEKLEEISKYIYEEPKKDGTRVKKIENFLKIKLQSISHFYGNLEKVDLYKEFYNDIANSTLVEMFAVIHNKLNDLFSFLNSKNVYGEGGHYNAIESRELIEVIKETETIINTLKKENYLYEIDTYYLEIIERCKAFLSSSGGSSIPEDFPMIELIDYSPIFISQSTISISTSKKDSSTKIYLIGGGSYADVFYYTDPHYDLNFAIKRAKQGSSIEELKRFKIEYEELKSLDSPYIIQVYRYNEDQNEYIMECADETLEKYLRYNNQYLSVGKRKRLISQVLKAFKYIHDTGKLHRDISYRNILLKHFDDKSSIIKVSDFGLVKRDDSQLTRQGTSIKGALNDYSDLSLVGFENYKIIHETYVISKIVYFILTGKESNYHREKNPALRNFVLNGISSEKKERFQSVEEIEKALYEDVYPYLVDEVKREV